MISQAKLARLINKRIKNYSSTVAFINDVYKMGLSRHACMSLELLILNKPYDRVKHVLLFTDKMFNGYINEIEDLLRNFRAKKKLLHFSES